MMYYMNTEMICHPDSGIPLYRQMADSLRSQITSGKYTAGQKIPAEAELGECYGVSRVTVRKAIELLIREGLVKRQQGLGTYVATRVFVESPNAGGSFAASCRLRGVEPHTKLLHRELHPAGEALGADLGLAADAPVFELHRLRLAGNVACIYEVDYLAAEQHPYIASAKLEDASLLELIRRETDFVNAGVEDLIDITPADDRTAQQLECRHGTPLLSVYQKIYASNDSILYVNRQFIRSDRYKYVYSNRSAFRE